VLGHALEEIYNTNYESLLSKNILVPLNFENTGMRYTPDVISNMAVGYQGESIAPLLDIGWEAPAGQMYSTSNDLTKLMNLFFRYNSNVQNPNQIVEAETLREWRTPQYINNDLSGFGIPWEIYSSPILYTKGGAMPGYLSAFLAVPDLKFGAIILQSTSTSDVISQVSQKWSTDVVLQFAQSVLTPLEPPPTIPANVSQFLGIYTSTFLGSSSNTTVQMGLVPGSKYEQVLMGQAGSFGVLSWKEEDVYLLNFQGVPVSCATLQDGQLEYVIFKAGNPPTFTMPGYMPGATAVRIVPM